MPKSLKIKTSPSLALIKYWGKQDTKTNTPATGSLAVSLEGLTTETTITLANEDAVFINGKAQPAERFAPFFHQVRKSLGTKHAFHADSHSNFPVAAGLASSSSGFAALAYGCAKLINPYCHENVISSLARLGSASAARAVFGGFTLLEQGSLNAEPLNIAWPDLRIIICIVQSGPKEVSSREAMERARHTSPYYSVWLEQSANRFPQALEALKKTNLSLLGPLIRESYLGMFATMLTSQPPVLYWQPDTMALLKTCEILRHEGYEVWETMDAGPQVKMFCLKDQLENILSGLKNRYPDIQLLVSKPGPAPTLCP